MTNLIKFAVLQLTKKQTNEGKSDSPCPDGLTAFNRVLRLGYLGHGETYLYLLLILFLLPIGCNNPGKAVLTGVCDEDSNIDNSWIYIYKMADNDYYIADSCLIESNRFKLSFDVPYEDRYILFAPKAPRCKMLDIVLRPGDRLSLHLPNQGKTRNDISFMDLEQSPATKTFYNVQRASDSTEARYRATRDICGNYPVNSAA